MPPPVLWAVGGGRNRGAHLGDLQRDGLARASYENRLFAITGFSCGSAPTLHVFPDAGKLDTALSLQAPATSHKDKN
ncbi:MULTISPECIES: hypothetical protein [Streptomyces]|uniref:hypothetical protein n=1 Tax=Streptomyces TaxID=1883 RepID=UPI0006B4F9F7|nr:hypothetical protein [Streptomyces sp. NRRL S-4]KPC84154.1 hypothetical protein ADK82_04815 [Streptomyces sp. NRRL S-4]